MILLSYLSIIIRHHALTSRTQKKIVLLGLFIKKTLEIYFETLNVSILINMGLSFIYSRDTYINAKYWFELTL